MQAISFQLPELKFQCVPDDLVLSDKILGNHYKQGWHHPKEGGLEPPTNFNAIQCRSCLYLFVYSWQQNVKSNETASLKKIRSRTIEMFWLVNVNIIDIFLPAASPLTSRVSLFKQKNSLKQSNNLNLKIKYPKTTVV